MTNLDEVFENWKKFAERLIAAREAAALRPGKFRSPFTTLEKEIYCDGMNYEPVYKKVHAFCICDIKTYTDKSRQLTMWRFVFDNDWYLN